MNIKKLAIQIILVLLLSTSFFVPSFAQTVGQPQTNVVVSCKDSWIPRFLCERYVSWTTNFTYTKLLDIAFSIGQAVLLVFVLYQITKGIFQWVSKPGEDKARQEAIKHIVNALAGFGVFIVLLFIVPALSGAFGIDGKPNQMYACYRNDQFLSQAAVKSIQIGYFNFVIPPGYFIAVSDIDQNTATVKTTSSTVELPNVVVYEGVPENDDQATAGIRTGTKNKFNGSDLILSSAVVQDTDFIKLAATKLYCKDTTTGKEYNKGGYVILKRIVIQK